MKNTAILSFLISFAIITTSCKGSKKAKTTDAESTAEVMSTAEPVAIKITKGNCFGRCPVFELSVAENGDIDYYGKMFVEKEGRWTGKMEATHLQTLHSLVEQNNVFALEDEYLSGAMDLPKSTLTVTKNEETKKIRGDFALPDAVKDIITLCDSLSRLNEWKQVEANVPREAVEGELIVKMKVGEPTQVCKDFEDYDLRVKRQIAPNLPMYLLSFSPEKIKPGRLIILLREHEAIEQAQFNQEVSDRE